MYHSLMSRSGTDAHAESTAPRTPVVSPICRTDKLRDADIASVLNATPDPSGRRRRTVAETENPRSEKVSALRSDVLRMPRQRVPEALLRSDALVDLCSKGRA